MNNYTRSGVYVLPRGWMEWTAFGDRPYSEREAFLWLVESAAFEPIIQAVEYREYRVQAGQLVCSLRYMAVAWGWDKDRVSRWLKKLRRAGLIDSHRAPTAIILKNGYEKKTPTKTNITLITILNYRDYQSFPDKKKLS